MTRDILESHLYCKYKSYLKLVGQKGIKSDYEIMLTQLQAQVRAAATDKILGRYPGNDALWNGALTTSLLKQGRLFLLDVVLDYDFVSLHLDGLKKVDGSSQLGAFHYSPMLFYEGWKPRKEQRVLLDIYGLILSRLQGRTPANGIIWLGKECKTMSVRLNFDLRKAGLLLEGIKKMSSSASPPKLMLNEHCHVCEFCQQCHNQAVQEDNLSLLRNIGEKEIKNLARKGILTLTQLAHTFRPRKNPKRASHQSQKRYHALHALAIRDKTIYIWGTPKVPISPVIVYLDIEGTPNEGYIYLIGLLIVEDGMETRHSLWAVNKDEERGIFEQFLAIVAQYKDFVVFCYGGYEKTFLKRMSRVVKKKKLVVKILNTLVNTLSLIYSHIYFPTYSNGLKEVARYIGCSWSEPDSSGLQSIVWRSRWEENHDDDWKQKLLIYNLEDCAALRKVTELIHSLSSNSDLKNRSLTIGHLTVPISGIQDLDKLSCARRWGKVNFYHPDYEYINNCAYFDYQRDRVYIRTSPTIRKSKAKEVKKSINARPRTTNRMQIVSSSCPACKSKEVAAVPKGEQVKCWKPRVKWAFDLVFTPGGIRRKIVECRTYVHHCLKCDHEFVPDKYQRLEKHFHSLKSWSMFEHITHRLSFRTIQGMLEEFFGLHVHHNEIHMFKMLMARYYRVTYSKLLKTILAGKLLHIDETQVTLKAGKGYVWVFTSLEEVVFMYRPTREGDFLQKLLKNFHGVMVSDFYAAYDSIDCPQQKCLIHLIRDINQELLRNPYDEELQLVTRPFGILLRALVSTVDEHGLKRRYLQRHKRAVTEYFQHLSNQSFRSEAAESLRERLIKNQNKLFTFIEHDGVPWNNNNAENGIKYFAYYREDTVGVMNESGLTDYLILLSIYQTCRYKGVSFLKFLLSREKDVDVFCEGRRRKRRQPVIEVYPKGFMPPHLKRFREKAMSK